MKNWNTALLVAACALWLVPAALGAEKKKDTIILKDGKTMEVPSVIDENFANLKFRRGGKESRIKITLVKQVLYYDAPDDFHTAMGLFGSKKYQDAAQSFDRALQASGVRSWIKQYATFYMAECYRKMGKNNTDNYRTAVEKYLELLSQVPETRFLPEAMFYIGDCRAALKQYDQAVTAYRKLQTEVSKKALEQRWALLADLAEGRVLELKKDYLGAFHKYTSIHSTASRMGLKEVANQALLRKGLALLSQKKYPDAEKYFNDLFKKAEGESTDVRSVKGGACIGLGRCFLQKKDYPKARLWFLRSMVVYFTNEEFHPQAMYYAGFCFHELKREKGSKAHAKAIFKELIRRYPQSEWAKKAKGLGYK